jgi:DNA-binding IclR family transcriptional regulator
MAKPGPAPDVTAAAVRAVFAERSDTAEPLTASEVAEHLGCTSATARKRLDDLAERGVLATKTTGARSRVWWRPATTTAAEPDGPLFAAEPLFAAAESASEEDIDDIVYR